MVGGIIAGTRCVRRSGAAEIVCSVRTADIPGSAKQAAAPLSIGERVLIDAVLVVNSDQRISIGKVFEGKAATRIGPGSRNGGDSTIPGLQGNAIEVNIVGCKHA